MTDRLTDAELQLLEVLTAAARGPKQDGAFALWLLVRYCDGMLPPASLTERIARRRFEQLERRLSSLTLPAPLRRGIAGALRELRDGGRPEVSLALHQLVAPSRDALGTGAADALFLAAGLAREAGQETDREP